MYTCTCIHVLGNMLIWKNSSNTHWLLPIIKPQCTVHLLHVHVHVPHDKKHAGSVMKIYMYMYMYISSCNTRNHECLVYNMYMYICLLCPKRHIRFVPILH